MTFFVNILTNSRLEQGLSKAALAKHIGIAPSLVSRYENNDRLPPEQQLMPLAHALQIPYDQLRQYWYAEKIARLVQYEPNAAEIWEVAESRIQYLRSSQQTSQVEDLPTQIKKQLKDVDTKKAQWQQLRPLKGIHLEKIQSYFRTINTCESNHIEGNTLTLQETELVINQGVTISGKSMREHLEAINHAEAIDLLYDFVSNKEDLSERHLLNLHALILRGIDRSYAGRYRDVSVRISGSQHIPPDALLITDLMNDYFEFYHKQKARLHPVILAAEMHERLVTIHPFIDGNGRTARLIMNMILIRHGYTIVNLKGNYTSRIQYYQALEKIQIDNDRRPFYQLICESQRESLDSHLEWVT